METPEYINDDFLTDLAKIHVRLKNKPYSLCDLAGKCEAEMMVYQTVMVAVENHGKYGAPFSFRGDGCDDVSGGGLCDNPAGMDRCLSRGWFDIATIEVAVGVDVTTSDGKAPIIWPTPRLLADLKKHMKITN